MKLANLHNCYEQFEVTEVNSEDICSFFQASVPETFEYGQLCFITIISHYDNKVIK